MLNQRVEGIDNIDLSGIMARVVEKTGMNTETATKAEDLYRKYITLKVAHSDVSVVPPKMVDAVWHEHLTDTRKYIADCNALGQNYIHHNPNLSDEELAQGWENACRLYEEKFSVDLQPKDADGWMAASTCGG